MTVAFPPVGGAASGRITILETAPVKMILTKAGDGATGKLTVLVRDDSTVGGLLDVRLVTARGPAIRLTEQPTPGRAISLTTPRKLPMSIAPAQIRRIPLNLTLAKPPDKLFAASLLVGVREVDPVTPAAIKLDASMPAPGGSRWAKAYLEPVKLSVTASGCWPRFTGIDCRPPHPPALTANGLTAGAEIRKGTVIAQSNAASDTGGRADVTLKADENIGANSRSARLRLEVNHLTRGGKYEVSLPTDRTADKAPSLTASVTARDFFLWPLLVLAAGTGVAWWLLKWREGKRPKLVLQHALKAVATRYRAAQSAAKHLTKPYDLSGMFPPGDDWKKGSSPIPTAVQLYRKIEDDNTQEKLDEDAAKVGAITAQADGWLETCRKASALQEAVIRLKRPPHPEAEALVAASEKLIDHRQPPADAAELARYQSQLDDQAAAIDLWLSLEALITRAQNTYELVQARELDDDERARLEQFRPDALSEAYLKDASNLRDLKAGRVVARVREHIRVLAALEAANPQDLVVAEGRRGDGAESEIDSATLQAALLAADGVPDERRTEASRPQSADELLAAIMRRDRLDFLVSLAIATVAFFATIYPKETFGSVWDYLAAFAAGAAGQLVVNWKLLPWYRSYRPEPADAKAAAEAN